MAGNFQGISFSGLRAGYGFFSGLVISYETGIRFIKVIDFRGNPIKNTTVIAENLTGDYEQLTDENGIALMEIDIGGTVVIKLKKDKTNLISSFNYASDPTTKTIILQPRILE